MTGPAAAAETGTELLGVVRLKAWGQIFSLH